MLICFLCAMVGEANPVLEKVTVLNKTKVGFATLHECECDGIRFFLAVCGVGKVLSASGLSGIIVAHPEIDSFVNLGIGGSLDAEKAPLLSAVVGKGYVQHDMDTTVFGDPKGFLWGLDFIETPAEKGMVEALSKACRSIGLKVTEGVIVSGDTFVADEEKKAGFVKEFGAISVDMEAAAYAETAYVYGKPFTALRIISDAVDHQKEYELYKENATSIGSDVAIALLKQTN